MATAEQLLQNKKMCEAVEVLFPAGTLIHPYDQETHGLLYRCAPVGTLIIRIQKKVGYEYLFGYGKGDIFTLIENTTEEI